LDSSGAGETPITVRKCHLDGGNSSIAGQVPVGPGELDEIRPSEFVERNSAVRSKIGNKYLGYRNFNDNRSLGVTWSRHRQ